MCFLVYLVVKFLLQSTLGPVCEVLFCILPESLIPSDVYGSICVRHFTVFDPCLFTIADSNPVSEIVNKHGIQYFEYVELVSMQ